MQEVTVDIQGKRKDDKRGKPMRFMQGKRNVGHKNVYVEYFRQGNEDSLTLVSNVQRLFNHLQAKHSITVAYVGDGPYSYVDVYRIPIRGRFTAQYITDELSRHGLKAHAVRRRDKGKVPLNMPNADAPGRKWSDRGLGLRKRFRDTAKWYDWLFELWVIHGDDYAKAIPSQSYVDTLHEIATASGYSLPGDWKTNAAWIDLSREWIANRHYKQLTDKLASLEQFIADNAECPDSVRDEYFQVKAIKERIDELRSKLERDDETGDVIPSLKAQRIKDIANDIDLTQWEDEHARRQWLNAAGDYPVELPHASYADTLDVQARLLWDSARKGYYPCILSEGEYI